jgi:hypothetical protein
LSSRVAVSQLPLSSEVVSRITRLGVAQTTQSLGVCTAYGLLHRFSTPDQPASYHPPAVLRSWLADPERLPTAEARFVNGELAAYWQSQLESIKREERQEHQAEFWLVGNRLGVPERRPLSSGPRCA